MEEKDYSKVLFYDTETVGINPNYIVSIAYMLYKNGKKIDTGYVICNPDYPISKRASEVNGFTNESVEDKPLFGDVWPEIKHLFTDSVWIGHNSNRFDQDAMRLEFKRYGIKEPHHYNLDTLNIAKGMLKKNVDVKDHKLGTLCEHFGLEIKGYHQAHVDTWACQKVFNKLTKMNEEQGGIYDNLFIPQEVFSE